MTISRRKFLGISAVAGASMALPWKFGVRDAYAFAQSDPLQKWIQPIRGLGGATGIPVMTAHQDPVFGKNVDYYQIGIGEFTDHLHPALGPTHLWGYFDLSTLSLGKNEISLCDASSMSSLHITLPVRRHLGGIIVAQKDRPTRIRFSNLLPLRGGHILPVDTTIPGANQAFNRTAVHLHGGHVPWISDGGPHDWWNPLGQHGLSFMNNRIAPQQFSFPWQADYYYPNDQSARLQWYHDHAWGITRLNAYAGIASGYLLTDAIAEARFADLAQVPLIWQDKIFVSSTTASTDPTWADIMPARVQSPGSLWYQHVYEPDRWDQGPGMTPPNPSSVPEAFGDTMLCNGTVYPYLDVQPGAYRFRMLNACSARFLNINLFVKDLGSADGINLDANLFPTNPAGPDMIQIGTEGGFLPKAATLKSPVPFNPVTVSGNLLLGPAERADVIIDFSKFPGKTILMYSDSPAPFPTGDPRNDYFYGSANPTPTNAGYGPDTRQVLEIRVANTAPSAAYVVPKLPHDQAFLVPQTANVPLPPPPGVFVRDLTLNETFDQYGRLTQKLGTNILPGVPADGFGRDYMSAPTENVTNGSTEVWRIFNLTGDTHPMHFHLVNVQILSRQAFDANMFVNSGGSTVALIPGTARGPQPNELGYKETVRMNPGECTTVIMKFELPHVPFKVPASPRTGGNEYVWHCHILDHEEHDMMRPLVVT